MKGSVKKLLIFLVAVTVIIALIALTGSLRPADDFHEKYEGVDLMADVAGTVREGTYTLYQNSHAGAAAPAQSVEVDLCSFASGTDVEVREDVLGEKKALYTGSSSTVTWEVEIPESGLYNIYLEYLMVESRGVAPERTLYINGAVPFNDATNLAFKRIWTDAHEPRTDNQGNEIRPEQVEIFEWQSDYCRDDMGYITEPYQFYFEKGISTITLEAVNEPMILRKVAVTAIEEDKDYVQYREECTESGATGEGLTYLQIIQGEDATKRSESSLYAKYDKSAPNTEPYNIMNTVLNYTGGDAWRSSGQWIEWEFTVPEDGFYHISIKARQNYARGSVACRSLYLDGSIPFSDVKEIGFEYDNNWNLMTLSDENKEPYEFYLTKGSHTIRLEATLGGMGAILEELEDSTFRLNQIYRKLLVYTGATPDTYRDYRIEKVYPEIIEAMELEAKRLYKAVDDTVAYTGQKAEKIAAAQTLARQLERFVERPDKITREFTAFKDNITALGTATLNMTEIKLDVDYLVVNGVQTAPKKDTANFFTKAVHEVRAFIASFVVDYNAVGDVYEEDDDSVIKVWVATGRDQGTILKTMIDDTFTPETGIRVNLEIVDPSALLSAVLAGRGPDVVLSVEPDKPVNYALRNAAEDITQFADYEEVLAPYEESSYIQYRYQDGIFGIPETQVFSVMFYRKDVLEELELELPQTWKELIEMLPTIQGNSMSVGIPSAAGSSSTASGGAAASADLTLYFCLLYQYGGDMYNEAGTKAAVNEECAVEAFDDYTRYFTDYGIPTVYDFVSRFRSGEMPIGIMPYSIYNTLMVSAPEIRGLWDFTLIPGTEKVDEEGNTYIDRSDFVSAMATMMIKSQEENEKKKLDAWEFMKWWSKADTQVRYGREIEALLGTSARYATANREAFAQLAWSAEDINILNRQWDETVGIREVPGGYFAGRHITNAIRKVINKKVDPRETIIDYTIQINEELTKKRKEFGLPVEE